MIRLRYPVVNATKPASMGCSSCRKVWRWQSKMMSSSVPSSQLYGFSKVPEKGALNALVDEMFPKCSYLFPIKHDQTCRWSKVGYRHDPNPGQTWQWKIYVWDSAIHHIQISKHPEVDKIWSNMTCSCAILYWIWFTFPYFVYSGMTIDIDREQPQVSPRFSREIQFLPEQTIAPLK